MSLPLHVFEPRYKKMVEDALAGGGAIGMVLLRPGWERDYHGRPPVYELGCAGTIEEHEALPEGRYNMVLKGAVRFRILEEHAGEPYRLARVEPLPDPLGDPDEVEAARREVLAAVARASDGPSVLVMQAEMSPDLFVNALGQWLTLTPLERQSLLECGTVLARYRRLIEILDFRNLEETHKRPGHDRKVH
jgi:Lon protease-like protein